MSDRYDELHDGRLSALYRETRDVEPPEWLDQRILNRARSVTESRPALVAPLPVPKRRTARWTVPLALAATVVLTVGVVVSINRESGELEATVRRETTQSTLQSATEADAGATGRAVSPPAESDLSSRAAPSIAPTPSEPLGGSLAAPAPAAPQPTSSPPTAPRQRSITSLEQERKVLDEAAPAQAGKKAAVEADRIDYSSPQEWLARITELRRQGRMAEAEASLAEFRRQYPHYPLDAETLPR